MIKQNEPKEGYGIDLVEEVVLWWAVEKRRSKVKKTRHEEEGRESESKENKINNHALNHVLKTIRGRWQWKDRKKL